MTKILSLVNDSKFGESSRNLLSVAAVAIFIVTTTATLDASAARLYRYKDAAGGAVIASSVPNDRVKYGYQVIDETGRVMQEVKPQRTPEQAAQYLAKIKSDQQREEEIRRINLLYGSEADITLALDKALDSIDKSLANTQANKRQLESQLQRLETQAARIERAGTDPSPEMINNIRTLGEQIGNLEAEEAQRIAQKDVERRRHAKDRKLFLEVHGSSDSA